MSIKGKVHKFGADINTDVIIPARYLNISEAVELAKHCMEDIDTDFTSRVHPGDIIVAGTNFGCGSSREHAPLAIKAVGISCVIAASFARIFYRNAFNTSLPILECAEAAGKSEAGDMLEVELSTGEIVNTTKGLQLVSQSARDLFDSLSASRWQVLWKLRFPIALPYIFSALKISATLSVIGAIVGEMAGAKAGLGYTILIASYNIKTDMLFAAIVLPSILGIAFFGLVALIEKYSLYWHEPVVT